MRGRKQKEGTKSKGETARYMVSALHYLLHRRRLELSYWRAETGVRNCDSAKRRSRVRPRWFPQQAHATAATATRCFFPRTRREKRHRRSPGLYFSPASSTRKLVGVYTAHVAYTPHHLTQLHCQRCLLFLAFFFLLNFKSILFTRELST